MASFVYTYAKKQSWLAGLNLATSDMRLILCMTNTTADTEKDKQTISGFTTLDEYDGSGYSRPVLTGEAVNQDDPNLRAEFDANDLAPAWAALGAGTRQAQGMILYKHVTNDADSIPIAWIDSGGFPFAGNGLPVSITWNAEGILQLT